MGIRKCEREKASAETRRARGTRIRNSCRSRPQSLADHFVRHILRLVDESEDPVLTLSTLQLGGAVAQLGARLDGIEEVVGSNPIGSTKFDVSPLIHSQSDCFPIHLL
jgi:hypothetical protein